MTALHRAVTLDSRDSIAVLLRHGLPNALVPVLQLWAQLQP